MIAGTIYKITNILNGKVYVGQTTKPVGYRWKEHINNAKHGRGYLIGKALRKHGVSNFRFEVIIARVPRHDLNRIEIFWIKQYASLTKGYNCDAGGKGRTGAIPSKETRALWSKQRKGHTPWNKGTSGCFSQETIDKMSKAKQGKTPSNLAQLLELAKQRVGAKHQNAKLANLYNYTTDELIASKVVITIWARENGYSAGNLSATARGQKAQTKNIYAKYL